MSKTTDSISPTCVLCCQAIKIYAVGPCDHHICFRCSTKMRVLCNQKYCAVCRTEMPKVIFTQKLHPYPGHISPKFPIDRKHGIALATSKVQEEYRRLQDHRCPVCPTRRLPENTFKELQDHLRKDHEMFYCELCLKHLQVFTHERKCYSRRDLALHKRKGDPDDTSYKGHPLCEFCDDRYFDNDELLKHLRRQHYFCHFCENDGASNQYYNDYADLKFHFGEEHYLCREPECAEEFTHAFRTEIDLKAHRAKVHTKNMTRAQAKQARQIDIEVNLPPRPRDNKGLGGSGRGRGRRYDRSDRYDDFGGDTARALQASVDTARKEEHARKQEESAAAARKDRKVKKVTKGNKEKKSGAEGRRGSLKQDERHGSGSSSPVPMETEDNKENQRKNKKSSIPKEGDSSEAASKVSNTKKPEPERLPDFPSLSTFKPLTDETVTPTWGDAPSLSAVVKSLSSSSSSSKESGKKKKKDSAFTIEEPGPDLNLRSSSVAKGDDKKPKVSEQLQQPMWNVVSSSASSTSSSTKVEPSTKPPSLSWAAASPLPNQPTPNGPTPQSTWASSIAAPPKSQLVTKATWTNQTSTPNLGNSSDFPTLSSIASLLGGTSCSSSKKKKDNRSSNKPNESQNTATKHSDSDKKSASATSWKKVAEPAKSSSAGEASGKKISKKGQGSVSDNQRPLPVSERQRPLPVSESHRAPPGAPPGLSLTPASSSNATHRAPPGFGQGLKVNSPPPGFGVNVPSVPPNLPLDYVQPDNYAQRNLALLDKIKLYLEYDSAKLMIFKTVSGEFRRGTIMPAEYYGHCQDLLGDNLPKIFSELVSLLPDVIKQQQLLEAANDYKIVRKQKKEDKVLKISESKGHQSNRKVNSKAWGSSAEHGTCTQCGQVLLKVDMEAHLNSHQDFPSLTASVGTKSKPIMAPSSWGRIK